LSYILHLEKGNNRNQQTAQGVASMNRAIPPPEMCICLAGMYMHIDSLAAPYSLQTNKQTSAGSPSHLPELQIGSVMPFTSDSTATKKSVHTCGRGKLPIFLKPKNMPLFKSLQQKPTGGPMICMNH